MKAGGGVVYAQEGVYLDKLRQAQSMAGFTYPDPQAILAQMQADRNRQTDPNGSIGAPGNVDPITQRVIDRKNWENTPQDIPYWFGTGKENKYDMQSRAIQTSLEESDSRPKWLKDAGTAGQMFENIAGAWAGTGGGRGASTNNSGVYRVGQGFGGNKPQVRPSTPGLRKQLPDSRTYIPTNTPGKLSSQDSPKKPSGLLSAILAAGLKTTSPTRADQKVHSN